MVAWLGTENRKKEKREKRRKEKKRKEKKRKEKRISRGVAESQRASCRSPRLCDSA
jgi:hypothetical protein